MAKKMGKTAKAPTVKRTTSPPPAKCDRPAGPDGFCDEHSPAAESTASGAPERFAAFLTERDLTNVEAGKLFDCAPSYITMLRRKQVTPGLDLAARIERVTGIPCKTWVD